MTPRQSLVLAQDPEARVIINIIKKHWPDTDIKLVFSESRKREEAHYPRSMGVYAARIAFPEYSLKRIGAMFKADGCNARDHSTMINCITAIEDRMSYDKKFKRTIEIVVDEILLLFGVKLYSDH